MGMVKRSDVKKDKKGGKKKMEMISKQIYQETCKVCGKVFESLHKAQLDSWVATHMRAKHPSTENK